MDIGTGTLTTPIPDVLKFSPAVCAVKNEYQILVLVNTSCVLWVRIGENTYFDDSNGILRSDTDLHRVTVPMSVLDAAGGIYRLLAGSDRAETLFSDCGRGGERDLCVPSREKGSRPRLHDRGRARNV